MSRAISGMVLVLLLVGTSALTYTIRPAGAAETTYIRSDGTVDPAGAPITRVDGGTYVFSGDLYGPLVVERNNTVIDGANYTVEGDGTGNGITLSRRSKVTIKNMVVNNFSRGIYLNESVSNTLSGNHVTGNDDGIGLDFVSDNNILFGNKVTDNNSSGICLTHYSNNNIIYGNEITDNGYSSIGNGVELWFSSNNILVNNNITANHGEGIRTWQSSSDTMFHNNFINNSDQAYTLESNSKWDAGYPLGGNYWSEYAGGDSYRGPYQNMTGSDNIGDVPYTIDANNTDRYPLTRPWTPSTLTLKSDLNGDRTVDILDIAIVARAFGSKPGDRSYNVVADLNLDGLVNIMDVTMVAKDYGKKVA